MKGKTTKNSAYLFPLVIFALAFLQYANTIPNDYAWDDAIVIRDNPVTKKGIAGLAEIWTTPAYITQRSLYRPIPQTTFALEQSLFGDNPHVGHFVNALLYALCCLLLFFTLKKLLSNYHIGFTVLVTLLFVVHPVHTEVVANIKSRDEILALTFGLGSLIFFLKFVAEKNWRQLFWVALFWGLACLSKLNAITLLAVFPLIYLFKKTAEQAKKGQHASFSFNFSKNDFTAGLNLIPPIGIVGKTSLVIIYIALLFFAIFTFQKVLAFALLVIGCLYLVYKKGAFVFLEWVGISIIATLMAVLFNLEYSFFLLFVVLGFWGFEHKKWDKKMLVPVLIPALGLVLYTSSIFGLGLLFPFLFFVLGVYFDKAKLAAAALVSGGIVGFITAPIVGLLFFFVAALSLSKIYLPKTKSFAMLLAGLCLVAFVDLFFIAEPSIAGNIYYQNQAPTVETPQGEQSGELALSILHNNLNQPNTGLLHPTIAAIQLRYLGKLFVPHPLVHTYGVNSIPMTSWSNWLAWLSVLLHLLLFLYGAIRIFKGDPVAFGILWYFITISIYSNIVMLGPDTMAERFLFFPSIGFVLALVFTLAALLNVNFKQAFTGGKNMAFYGILGIILIAFSIKTMDRNGDWKDNRSLATTTLPYAPNSALINANFAGETFHHFENNDPQNTSLANEAIAAYERAISIHPNYFTAMLDLAMAYLKTGQNDKAMATYQKASLVNAESPLPYYYMGLISYTSQDYNKGSKLLQEALDRYKNVDHLLRITDEAYSQSYMFLARCQFNLGSPYRAKVLLEKAANEMTADAQFYVLLGKMYGQKGDLETAVSYLRKALERKPGDGEILGLLGEYGND